MKRYKITVCYIVTLLVLIISACTKMDNYKNIYMKGGAIIYPAKLDSVQAFSGKNRVKITGLFTADPSIVKYKVFWNSRQDSIEVPVKRTNSVDTAKVIIPNLPEGLMSFEIRTYDAQGHISIPVTLSANVYGDLYQSSLTNRAIVDAGIQSDGSALITWADVNTAAGIINMEIKYSDNNGKAHDTLVTSVPTGLTTSLPNFKVGNTISYRTSYLPNPTAIDTFYVAYQTHSVKADVTSLYLTNTGNPFKSATFDNSGGRWGTLAGWITSPSVINHWGYGGYANDNGGSLVMEMGWSGTAAIQNGKIYQTTTLPAGNYIFQIVIATNGSIDPVYIVVATGATLPDVSNISSSLAYTGFQNLNLPFTVTQQGAVSLGFLATMTTGNQYWAVTSVQLIKN
ncbi:DUF4998 domain-containing protein [Mucilaginibacter sp. L196]|uniref:DUF4998 domain-containing protein n=1 Tax=Mucilaginibacter sp. L196 TaxID=1641870 RepID=UPI00131E10C8|nr:DUF4998 domain-containing protein [Mucilaginibacter sp. L196]